MNPCLNPNWIAELSSPATSGDVRLALISLYRDQIRPSQSDLSRRLMEFGIRPPDLGGILNLIGGSESEFRLVVDAGMQIYIEFCKPPGWFVGWVDPTSSANDYSIELWGLFHHFVLHCPYEGKGGRYGFARRLYDEVRVSRFPECEDCLAFIQQVLPYTVGRLCQFVQQSISQGILRYEDNVLQPSSFCRGPSAALAARLAEGAPTEARPLPKGIPGTLLVTREVESIAELETYLLQLCMEGRSIPLAQLKKKLIDEFRVVLNPIKFGFTKVSEVFKNLAPGVFELENQRNNCLLKLKLY